MIKNCIVQDCSNHSHARGKYCSKHEARIRRNGNSELKSRNTLEQRLMAKIKVINDCWIWQGVKTTKERPYGRLFWNGKQRLTHHLSYQNFKGEIPDGLMVCHTCDNHSCINPKHLWLGTASDNMKDMVNKNRAYFNKNHKYSQKYSDDEILAIHDLIKVGFKISFLAKTFNQNYQTFCSLIRRRK